MPPWWMYSCKGIERDVLLLRTKRQGLQSEGCVNPHKGDVIECGQVHYKWGSAWNPFYPLLARSGFPRAHLNEYMGSLEGQRESA